MVHFVDPDVPALALTVRALAQMPYVVEPARIDLEKVKPSASSTHQVNIKMNDGSPAYLQNTKASADWLRVTQSNDDEVATVNISVTTPLVSGSYNEDVDGAGKRSRKKGQSLNHSVNRRAKPCKQGLSLFPFPFSFL